MCTLNIEAGGYKLKSGKFVTPDNVEQLSKDEIEELLTTNISAWEFLMLRKSNHNLVNAINGLTGNMQDRIDENERMNKDIAGSLKRIEDSLVVEVQNGEKHKKKLGDVVVELWNLHKGERDKKKLFQSINRYKIPILIVSVVAFGLSIKFHNQVNQALQSTEDFIYVAISAGVILSVIGYALRMILEKKIRTNRG